MLNVLIAGVGGQGSVLAAKILAQAATEKGWQVRTAETIGMAQRGGNVLSHVRMGNLGEEVYAPLVPRGHANCIIALEPGEGLRALPYLAPDGLLVSAQTGIGSVTAALSGTDYSPRNTLVYLQQAVPHFASVDDTALCETAGSRKALNVGLLAATVRASLEQNCGLGQGFSTSDLENALAACVKPQFLEMNLAAVHAAFE